jgi:hypothetical protein
MRGVALDGTPGVSIGRFVHHETAEWTVTSAHPIEFLQTCAMDCVYSEVLPGRLGMFLYPSDARFHMKDRETTSRIDLDTVVRSERVMLRRERAMNMHHLSVHGSTETETFVPNQEVEVESDDEDPEEEQDEEEDGPEVALEQCIESDDEPEG